MGKINLLTRDVYNRIAAGEVIDRPYSVVKELVENSIDAGATEIEIYIEQGGKQLVKVIDNGCGIEKDDLPLAFLPHATSKIKNADDLAKILTLGFRGEALASISVVARVELTSATEGGGAYKIVCEDEKVGEPVPASLEKGTVICVRDLFYNTPVRAKFLKTDKKEESDVTNFVTRFILGNPKIAFKYYIDKKLVLQSYGGGLDEALAQVYGAKVLSDCYKINAVRGVVHMYGFIGNQNFFKPNKSCQSIFLNGRYVVNNSIATAISNAYAAYTMKRQFPFYVLNIDVPTDSIDVNVHPNKADVRFVDGRAIFGAIYGVVSAVLDGTFKAVDFVVDSARLPYMRSTSPDAKPNSVYSSDDEKPSKFGSDPAYKEAVYEKVTKDGVVDFRKINYPASTVMTDGDMDKSVENVKFEDFLPPRDVSILRLDENIGGQVDYDKRVKYEEAVSREAYERQQIEFESFKYKGNLFNTYLIYESENTVYFIDQHAAHERLLYDSLRVNLSKRKIATQELLMPYVISVSPVEKQFILENIPIFKKIGFKISEFGFSTFKVESVPADLMDISVQDFFDEVLKSINSLKQIKLEDVLKDRLAMTACKHAVRGGHELSQEEADVLFGMLKGNIGLKCPHGRPVCVTLTKTQIEKMFKRIVN